MFIFKPQPQNDMYSLQLTKRIYSPKNQQSKQLLFRNTPPKTCQADAENSPQENPAPRDWLTSELLAPFVIFWPNTWEILPKVWSPPHQTSQIQESKHDNGKIQKRLSLFHNSMFTIWNCKHVGSRCQCVAPAGEAEGEGKKKGSPGSPISWKLICDPLMKSSSFGIKLNVQRYLSVGISLIALREVSDRLMQVLTWASPRILQWTDTVSAPHHFILRLLKSCWETSVRGRVPSIRVHGWEADLVSTNVGVCLQTAIILWQNIRPH